MTPDPLSGPTQIDGARFPEAQETQLSVKMNMSVKSTITRKSNKVHAVDVLLQERRAALISAAVTGKIDVRQFATEAVA